MNVLLINGPNLQLLGRREKDIYGTDTLADIERRVAHICAELGVELECRQSNYEGEITEWIGGASELFQGVVLNPAAYTHTSIAIRDAVAAIDVPVVEVHLSNIHAREAFRRTSLVADACVGQISGFGVMSYELAVRAVVQYVQNSQSDITET